ncbi:hypothetical protein MTR67_017735 [Solanum verrucosum]|uniref:Uncharacterized protein n=1 Tax=Solanum verrucosum TaxID=315347 RepID=A0AAF0QL33_SOLVR|nr:hypothetical protein MTR67_017735 [Solanum verrucosum]
MAFNMSSMGAKTLSPTVSRELVLFESNSLFQIVLKSTMSLKELLGAWGDNNLIFEELIEQQNVPTDQCAYWWCLTMIYMFIDHISFWIDICTFECIVVTIQLTRIVTCKWLMVAQPIKLVQEYNDILLISEIIDEKRAIAIVVALNLEDKVLIGDGSIVMNQPQPDRNFDITKSVIGPKSHCKENCKESKGFSGFMTFDEQQMSDCTVEQGLCPSARRQHKYVSLATEPGGAGFGSGPLPVPSWFRLVPVRSGLTRVREGERKRDGNRDLPVSPGSGPGPFRPFPARSSSPPPVALLPPPSSSHLFSPCSLPSLLTGENDNNISDVALSLPQLLRPASSKQSTSAADQLTPTLIHCPSPLIEG